MNALYPPSVAQQIEAVQLAEIHVVENMNRLRRRPSEIEEVSRRLRAAVETLRMLEDEAAR
jgi:septation ring formation regulator EzrA